MHNAHGISKSQILVNKPVCPSGHLQVLVLRLQTCGTVEERIIEVASQKLSMTDKSITGDPRNVTIKVSKPTKVIKSIEKIRGTNTLTLKL